MPGNALLKKVAQAGQKAAACALKMGCFAVFGLKKGVLWATQGAGMTPE
jgi:hypothetical protein